MCLTQIPHPHSSRALQVTNCYVLSTTSQLYRLKVSYCDHRMSVVRQQFPLNNVFCTTWWYFTKLHRNPAVPGRVAQSVTCLATDACLTADPGVASSIPARSHTFVEIDHEIISTVILLPSADSFKKGCCQLQAKVCAQITG